MESIIKTDVLIVGAGPTGLALACQLIRYGVDFVIIDKKEGTTPFSKAIGVQARTLEIYQQIDIAGALINEGQITRHVRLLEGGEARAEVPLTKLGQGMSPYPYLLIVEQGKHEHLLYDFIKSHGREVTWQTALSDFSQDDAGVTATIISDNGKEQRVEAQYLVACDGSKSPVRAGLGLKFEGSTFERLFYVADVNLKWEFPHDMLTSCVARDRSTAFFPMKGEDRYRLVGKNAVERLRATHDDILSHEGRGSLSHRGRISGGHRQRSRRDRLRGDRETDYRRLGARARHLQGQLVFDLQGPLATRERVQFRPLFSGRRCRAYSFPRGGAGNEYRHPGWLQPRLEDRDGPARRS